MTTITVSRRKVWVPADATLTGGAALSDGGITCATNEYQRVMQSLVPAAWWRLGEAAPSSFADTMGGLALTVSGITLTRQQTAPTKVGDGDLGLKCSTGTYNQKLTAGISSGYEFSAGYPASWAFWAKLHSSDSQDMVLARGYSSGVMASNARDYRISWNGNPVLAVLCNSNPVGGSAVSVRFNTPRMAEAPSTIWHHYVVTISNAGSIRCWEDGVECSIYDIGTNMVFGANAPNNGLDVMGSYAYPPISKSLDELAYWNRELSEYEIRMLWSAGVGSARFTHTLDADKPPVMISVPGSGGVAGQEGDFASGLRDARAWLSRDGGSTSGEVEIGVDYPTGITGIGSGTDLTLDVDLLGGTSIGGAVMVYEEDVLITDYWATLTTTPIATTIVPRQVSVLIGGING